MTRQFTKSRDVVERKVRNNLILVPLKTGPARLDALYTLNDTAGFIWHQIDQAITEDEIVSRVIAGYKVDKTTAQNDVHRVLDGLASIGALMSAEQEA